MGLTATKGGSGKVFTPAPAGNHRAVCVGIYDLGTHPAIFEGKQQTNKDGSAKFQSKVMFTWELVDEPMDDGRPFLVSREFTVSLHEKATLRAFVGSWRGLALSEKEAEGFDLSSLLDATCMLNVVHKESKDGKVYANVGSATPIPKKGMAQPTAANDSKLVNLDDGVIPPDVAKWIANKIRDSVEFKDGKIQDLTPTEGDDEGEEKAKRMDTSKLPASADNFDPVQFDEFEAGVNS